jgi:hypothetical protein
MSSHFYSEWLVSLFKHGVRFVDAALRLQRPKRDRWLAEKRHLAEQISRQHRIMN